MRKIMISRILLPSIFIFFGTAQQARNLSLKASCPAQESPGNATNAALLPLKNKNTSMNQDQVLSDLKFMIDKIEEAHADPYRVIAKKDFNSAAVRIEPSEKAILVIKTFRMHSEPKYRSIAREWIEVDAPGQASPNMKRFKWSRIPRPLFPIDELSG